MINSPEIINFADVKAFRSVGIFLSQASYISSFVPVVIGAVLFPSLTKDLKAYFFYFLFAALYDLWISQLALHNIPNTVHLNIYTIIDSVILLFLLHQYATELKMKRVLVVSGLLYAGFWMMMNFSLYALSVFSTEDKSVKCILFILLTSWILFRISTETRQPVLRNYKFWLLTGLIMYFSSAFILFVTATWMIEEENSPLMRYTWDIHALITILTNLILGYSFICFYRQRKLSST